MPTTAKRRSISKLLLVGLAIIAFGIASIVGNYVQWRDAGNARASIINADMQWVRRGASYLKLQVEFDVDGKKQRAEVSAFPKYVNPGEPTTIDILYLPKAPENVVSKGVLEEKRAMIPWALAAGAALSALGLWFQWRNPSSQVSVL
jgi:hypothetical protein